MSNKPTRFKVKNWAEFQHYKDRNPPWIKLHFSLLASEDWVLWGDESKLLAIACMLVASRNDGYVPNNPAYLKRVAYLDMVPDFDPLVSCGFLEIPLADASEPERTQADARPETEAERETEEKGLLTQSQKAGGDNPSETIEAIAVEIWNANAERLGLPQAQLLTEPRRKALRLRLADLGGIEGWQAMIEIIGKSPHLLGQNDRGWKASLDWVLKPANLTKVMEGNYVRTQTNRPGTIAAGLDAIEEAIRQRGFAGVTGGEEDTFELPRLRQGTA